jgi:HlyD family secretion protein
MKNFFQKFSRRTWTILGIAVVAFVVVAVLLSRRGAAQGNSAYQTTKLEKGNLTATVGATGTVRAKQDAVLVWQTNGTVDKVYVNVGDQVQVGDILASLLESSLPQNVILAKSDLVTAQRNLNDLLESESAKAQAQLTLASAQKAVDDAQKKVTSLNYPRASDDLIENTKSNIILAQDQVSRASDYYRTFRNKKDDFPPKAQALANLTQARINLDQLIANYNWYTGTPSENDAAELEANLAVAKAQLQDAQREWDRLKDGPDPKDVDAARAKVESIQATIDLARQTAPFAGTVTEVHPLPGDQVSAGTAAFRVDDLSHLLVDVDVSEVDINTIKIGQPVTMSFDAILGKEYHGQVVEVAQVGNTVQGVVNFTVTVELTDPDEQVKPGMTAAVNVVVTELKDVLLIPNRAVRLVNGNRVIYVLKNGQPQAVQIRLGASSDTMSALASGDLAVGDEIVLNPPLDFQAGGPPPFAGGQ